MLDFASMGLWLNIPLFAIAAVAVWMAGVRITRYANIIGEKTGAGQALIGVLLLGGITSLPELVVAITSSISGDSALAVNSILGGIAMQVAILALADALIGRRALTSVVPDPIIMLQGGFKILLLSIVVAAIVVGDVPVALAGLWMWLLIAVTGLGIWVMSRVQNDKPWIANDQKITKEKEDQRARKKAQEGEKISLLHASWGAAACGAVIVAAGYILSRTGDAIAEASGLGESFIGAVLVAIATSLPEVSTVFSAARAGLYTMAMSDIFGTNLFDVSFLFVIDVMNGSDAVMNSVGRFESFATIIAISVTAIFLIGLVERKDRTVLRMGYDSLAVLVIYLCGLVVLYFLRDGSGGGG